VRTRAIHAGDLVLVNHLGRVFYAKVAGSQQAGVLAIEPLDRRVTYRSAKAREVVDHWAHSSLGRDESVPVAQLRLEVAGVTEPGRLEGPLDGDEVLELVVRHAALS
jgi:hypothetical protein